MAITASALRGNIYKLLDNVLESGKPLEVERKGARLQIIPKKPISKLSRLTKHACIQGNPESIINLDWSDEWNHDLP
ncbi:MAG: type II toxin-antitoxin system Phd/YefM family antitoxin [Candidatus Electrothrix sp. AR5]|nr:type II toxin-antitoxin system Phd/YefM family antitoxin [Candidatus Electrothrix sp. AR5]